MPLTDSGKKVLSAMIKKHGAKGEGIFYASINKGVPGSDKWHVKSEKHSGTNQFTAGLANAQ